MFLAFLSARRVDHFEDDRFSHSERQRRLAAKEARPWRRALNWYLKIGVPAKILVTVVALGISYTVFIFGYIVGIIITVAVR